MSTIETDSPTLVVGPVQSDPAFRAYRILRLGFIVLPLVMGADKFFNLLADWPSYLAPWVGSLLPFSEQTAMYAVGVIEVIAGVAVAVAPRYAAWVVAAWLAGIIVNLVTYPGFFDVALRDVGLLVGAVALGLLAGKYAPRRASTRG